jgi:hypothetical protein
MVYVIEVLRIGISAIEVSGLPALESSVVTAALHLTVVETIA